MTRFSAFYYGKKKTKRLTSFNKESFFTTRNFNRSLPGPISETPYLNMRRSKEENEEILAKKCPGKITKRIREV